MFWARTFLTELHAWQWLGILIARVAVGLLFFLSGRSKLFVFERREQMRETLIAGRVPFPRFNTVFVSSVFEPKQKGISGSISTAGGQTTTTKPLAACEIA
jgi:uncharacterized membrane protein YphA (DoxX/SURF4 family)